MDVSVGKPWDGMVDALVKNGRYSSAREVVEEGLRLVEERERKLDWLRARLQAAIDRGGAHTDADVDAYLDDIERKPFPEGR